MEGEIYLVFFDPANFRVEEIGVSDIQLETVGNKTRTAARNFRFRCLIGARNSEMSDVHERKKLQSYECDGICTTVISTKATLSQHMDEKNKLEMELLKNQKPKKNRRCV